MPVKTYININFKIYQIFPFPGGPNIPKIGIHGIKKSGNLGRVRIPGRLEVH
jgi:hypothetical protein